jgi:hypothetical protein
MASKGLWAAIAATALVNGVRGWVYELPPCLAPFRPFVYTGCFQDTPGGVPALDWRTSLDSAGMTVEKCMAECKGEYHPSLPSPTPTNTLPGNGYRYAGLEYYGVCYCGMTVDSAQIDESKCSFKCDGNPLQTCGGDESISVFQDPTFPPIEDVTIEDYAPLGCWADDSPLGRTLVYQQELDSATLTTEKCLTACKAGGFPFAGTEFGGALLQLQY